MHGAHINSSASTNSPALRAPRAYEQAALDAAGPAARDKQRDRVRALWHRQLAVPLAGGEALMAEYEAWEEASGQVRRPACALLHRACVWAPLAWRTPPRSSPVDHGVCSESLPARLSNHPRLAAPPAPAPQGAAPDHVRKSAERARQAAALRAAHEAAVAGARPADAALLAAYLAYIKLEQAQGDPARVQVRAPRARGRRGAGGGGAWARPAARGAVCSQSAPLHVPLHAAAAAGLAPPARPFCTT